MTPDHAFTYALGSVVRSSSWFEWGIRELYASLIQGPRARVVAAGESVVKMQQGIRGLANVEQDAGRLDDSLVAAIKEAMELVKTNSELRNDAIHGFWIGPPKLPEHDWISGRSRYWRELPKLSNWTVAKLETLATDLYTVGLAVGFLSVKVDDALIANPYTPEPDPPF